MLGPVSRCSEGSVLVTEPRFANVRLPGPRFAMVLAPCIHAGVNAATQATTGRLVHEPSRWNGLSRSMMPSHRLGAVLSRFAGADGKSAGNLVRVMTCNTCVALCAAWLKPRSETSRQTGRFTSILCHGNLALKHEANSTDPTSLAPLGNHLSYLPNARSRTTIRERPDAGRSNAISFVSLELATWLQVFW